MTAQTANPQVRTRFPGRLGIHASTLSPERTGRRRKRRLERHELRYALRDVTRVGRLRQCGYTGVRSDGTGPGLRVTADGGTVTAGLSGLSTCGSVWACPVCSARIATVRASDLADVMRHGFRRGCDAAMVTLTMRHHEGQSLKELWDAVTSAWHAVTSGKLWMADKAEYALRGWVRVVEVTRGENGWHVHVHALMIFDRPVPLSRLTVLANRMWRRWNAALQRRGLDSLPGVGADVKKASLRAGAKGGLHEYFVKLSHEIAGGQAKLGRGKGRTPFQILADAVGGGEAGDLAAWWEWESVSRGRRQIAWSKGLREWAGLGAEQTDDEIAGEDLESEDMLFIDPESWRLLRHDPAGVCGLLEAAEDGGYAAAMEWLAGRGYGYVVLARWRRRE